MLGKLQEDSSDTIVKSINQTCKIIIQDPEQIEAFANAVEAASKHPVKSGPSSIRMVQDKSEFIELMKKKKTLYE